LWYRGSTPVDALWDVNISEVFGTDSNHVFARHPSGFRDSMNMVC
jgi:hypothetical protein